MTAPLLPGRRRFSRFSATAAAIVCGAGAMAQFPAAPPPAAPIPAPEFPAAFPDFTPPADLATPLSGTPALAQWNRTAGPGDTLTVTGSRFTALGGGLAGTDTGFVVFGQAGRKKVQAEVVSQYLAGNRAAITLPAGLPARSPLLIWPRNATGLGTPAVVNATEAWWLGSDTVTRGGSFAVHGRNLTPAATVRQSWIFLQPQTGGGRWIATSKANPYRAEYRVPADLENGTYRVWVHNSLGGALGWAGPLTLTVDDGTPWTGPVFNVRSYGAKGNGLADDYLPIALALQDAQATPGSTVDFPPGTYAIGTTLTGLPARVRLRGAGMDLTRLRPLAGFAASNHGLIFSALQGVEIRDLTFDTAGILDTALGNTLLNLRGSSRVLLDRVRVTQERDFPLSFTHLKDAIIDLHLCDHVTLRGCDIRASGGLFLGTSRQVFFEHCRFRGLNDLGAFIYLWGGRGVSLTGCTAADFDNRNPNDGHGWAQGRFLSGLGNWGACRDVYFGGNQTRDLTVRATNTEQNTGEQFLFEGLETLIRGTPDSVGADSVTFNGFTDNYTGQILVVVAGAGLGQTRQITAFNATLGKITLDRPWIVKPDATSKVVVGHYMSRMAVYGNALSAKARAAASVTHIASAGVQAFGGCVEFVVAGNTMKRLRYGISNWSLTNKFGAEQVLQPNYFNEFLGNRFTGCRYGATNWLKQLEAATFPLIDDAGMLGNLFRGNRFTGVKEPAFTYELSDGPPGVQMMIFDRNVGDRSPFVVSESPAGIRDQVLTGNRFRGTPATSQLQVLP